MQGTRINALALPKRNIPAYSRKRKRSDCVPDTQSFDSSCMGKGDVSRHSKISYATPLLFWLPLDRYMNTWTRLDARTVHTRCDQERMDRLCHVHHLYSADKSASVTDAT